MFAGDLTDISVFIHEIIIDRPGANDSVQHELTFGTTSNEILLAAADFPKARSILFILNGQALNDQTLIAAFKQQIGCVSYKYLTEINFVEKYISCND
jgi:hypothetical protein